MHFFIVDDDPEIIEFMTVLLEGADHRVSSSLDSANAEQNIVAAQPDCALLDIMMPGLDGLELCRRLRHNDQLTDLKIVVVSAKPYSYDRKRALEFGADGFISKLTDQDVFLEKVERIVADDIEIKFWGVHGTLPTPGPDTVRYGGNTSCVTVEFPKEQLFVFDAGSGIQRLAADLQKRGRQRLECRIFISHPHWDHINAIPFFSPLYVQGSDIEVLGPAFGDVGVKQLVSSQMDGVFFPINIQEFAANVRFRDLGEGNYDVDGVQVDTMLLTHPGHCLGYRVDYNGRRFCYITDNELYPESTAFYNPRFLRQLVSFVEGADVLVIDSTYSDEEYASHVHWGHSSVGEVARLGHQAQVKTLCLFHHDPAHTDDVIDQKVAAARKVLADLNSETACIAPHEGQVLRV